MRTYHGIPENRPPRMPQEADLTSPGASDPHPEPMPVGAEEGDALDPVSRLVLTVVGVLAAGFLGALLVLAVRS